MYNNYLTISQKKIVLNITFISNETRSYKKNHTKKVLLPVNQNYYKNWRKNIDFGYIFSLKKVIVSSEKSATRARAYDLCFTLSYYTVPLQACRVHCSVGAQIGLVITNHIR